jgi:hypothetical protein
VLQLQHVHAHVCSASSAEVAHSWAVLIAYKRHAACLKASRPFDNITYTCHGQTLVSERRMALEQSRAAVLHAHSKPIDPDMTSQRCYN